jgi:hypothetical protein
MPMAGAVLGAQIVAKIDALLLTDPNPSRPDFWREIAEAIVEHIQSNALVTVAVVSVSGVTSGGGVSGPGAGTGTIL